MYKQFMLSRLTFLIFKYIFNHWLKEKVSKLSIDEIIKRDIPIFGTVWEKIRAGNKTSNVRNSCTGIAKLCEILDKFN